MITTYHTYPDLLLDGGRLAATDYGDHVTSSQAIDYITGNDADVIILRILQGQTMHRGLMPGGIG
jgi:hypothetical protein